MFTIDIILPSLISYQKYPKLKKLQKLQFQKFALNARFHGNWFPVYLNLNSLKQKGVKIRFINYLTLSRKKLSNTVIFDSRIINNLIVNYGNFKKTIRKGIIPLLRKIKERTNYLIYADNADSTGHFHFDVLPYIDRYIKKQIYKDRSLYSKNLYKTRLFTDFYVNNYNFQIKEDSSLNPTLDPKYYNKIALSWNFAFKDYRYSNFLGRFFYGFSRKNNIKFIKPALDRKYDLSANYSIKQSYEIIYYQRAQLLKFLKAKYKDYPNICLGKIPKRIYLQTMRSSKAIVSPFGWGEICYRDFETFIAGAALIKPSMEHLDTWPNIYKENETYIPIPWKIEDWDKAFDEILSDEKKLIEVAIKGQDSYKRIFLDKGNEAFCKHFINIISLD